MKLTRNLPTRYITGDMDCYQIEWQGLYSFDEASRHAAAREMGVYVAYECRGHTPNRICYIGKSKELGQRIGTHRTGLARFLTEEDMRKYSFCLGTILFLERAVPSQDIDPKQQSNVESFLINYYQPLGNDPSTKKGYKGTPLLLISTGYLGKMTKLAASYEHLVPLITGKPNRSTKATPTKRKRSRSMWDQPIFS